jgi:hypothetical protein
MILLYPLGLLWALPFSILGAVLALLTLSKPLGVRGPALILKMGPVARWAFKTFAPGFNVAAYTWGVCVFVMRPLHDKTPGSSLMMVDRALVKHELEHVYQAMRWGPLFPFLYLGSMAVAAAQGKRAYQDCIFERNARKAEVRL